MMLTGWLSENIVELFGAVTGIAYVLLEIRRNILLWPLGIITSAIYIYVFGHNGLYANMGLQGYYLVISVYGWYAWHTRSEATQSRESGRAQASESGTDVARISRRTALICLITTLMLWGWLWFVLDRWTDSPVPVWDGLITSLSVVATWMLTRKYLEQWYVWIVANAIAVAIYLAMGLYPTAMLFLVYFAMAIIGVRAWKKQSAVDSHQSAVKN